MDTRDRDSCQIYGHAMGSNIDKYVDQFNPTLNLPGAIMALAGYSEYHRVPLPPSTILAIGDYVMEGDE
jgi:hypothetical protein